MFLAFFLLYFTTVLNGLQSYPEAHTGGIWVWNGVTVLSNTTEQDYLLEEMDKANLTDVYFYLYHNKYAIHREQILAFTEKVNMNGGRIWGLEGARAYFSDTDGPTELYQAVNAMIDYNKNTTCKASKFYGFITDMEPHDRIGSQKNFHSGLKDSSLSATSQIPLTDTDHWTSNQLDDRRRLMVDWLDIHLVIKELLSKEGLRLGAAMPQWMDNYYGEPVSVSWNGTFQTVMGHMMTILDEYHIMSYNTDPNKNWNRIFGEAQYAETLSQTKRPKVFGGVETNTGVGSGISYGDTNGKKSKLTVLQDIETIKQKGWNYTCFYGLDIHSFSGWKRLPP